MLEYFDTHTSRLAVGGIDFEKIVDQFRSPVYVYDAEIIRKKFQALRSAMPGHVDIFYAVKSNPNLSVIQLLAECGAGFDAASLGELQALQRLKIPGSRIVFTGPGKSDEEIQLALHCGIYSFNCESENEIRRIHAAAKKLRRRIKIGLRINTDYAIHETTSIVGGTEAKKFGIDENKIFDVIERTITLDHISIVGIHVFNATQVLDYQELAANTKNILRLAGEISNKAGLPLEYIDIGGGLGIPYAEDEREVDINALGEEFIKLYEDIFDDQNLAQARWILEPGRYLSGESGIFLAKVIDVKESRGTHFVITDAGINHFLRPALI
jgi:diaminopimelate decarboxylase